MNYSEQQSYLKQGRTWVVVLALIWLIVSALALAAVPMPAGSAIILGCVAAAIAVSLCYTPDYLHLTVNPAKKARWEIMIRWRLIALALVIGSALSLGVSPPDWKNLFILVIALGWLAAANLLARKIQTRGVFASYFWAADLLLLVGFLVRGHGSVLLNAGLLALAAHLSILVCDRHIFSWSAEIIVTAWLLLLYTSFKFGVGWDLVLGAALVLVAAATTALLVHRARKQNALNTRSALQELVDFTGYPADKIWRLWRESDKELARNWMAAAPDENDSQALAEWYRKNSELYMFAISGYNLDYKRICSNLKVLRYAQGACLDYGAGNGEIVLELARRGHRVTYYDVDGVSAKFARHRAQRQGLDVKFAHSKQELAAAVQDGGLDAIFSLDVLEHLPDLPGELTFLSGLLNPGGRLVFDVPAGSTKSHPMHLNHYVEVRSVLKGKGLREHQNFWQKMPFVKQEKYVFEKSP